MTKSEIRQEIAESGKMKVSDIINYFKLKHPNADPKLVKSEAKELVNEFKKFYNI